MYYKQNNSVTDYCLRILIWHCFPTKIVLIEHVCRFGKNTVQ